MIKVTASFPFVPLPPLHYASPSYRARAIAPTKLGSQTEKIQIAIGQLIKLMHATNYQSSRENFLFLKLNIQAEPQSKQKMKSIKNPRCEKVFFSQFFPLSNFLIFKNFSRKFLKQKTSALGVIVKIQPPVKEALKTEQTV